MAVYDENDREVDYSRYCKTCKHQDKDDNEEPCDFCLEEPYNYGTSKPVKWEKK